MSLKHSYITIEKMGELTSDEISAEIWMNISRESLGDSFDYDPRYKYFWSYIPHFIHSPFMYMLMPLVMEWLMHFFQNIKIKN